MQQGEHPLLLILASLPKRNPVSRHQLPLPLHLFSRPCALCTFCRHSMSVCWNRVLWVTALFLGSVYTKSQQLILLILKQLFKLILSLFRISWQHLCSSHNLNHCFLIMSLPYGQMTCLHMNTLQIASKDGSANTCTYMQSSVHVAVSHVYVII